MQALFVSMFASKSVEGKLMTDQMTMQFYLQI